MTSIYINQPHNVQGGPQVWSSRFTGILEARGFQVTSDLMSKWDSALFVADTTGMHQALATGRPVAYRVANGYLPAWFQQMGFPMRSQHHLVNARVAYGLAHASTVIYQSHWAKDSLDENFFCRQNEFAVIYNGVDLQRFAPAIKPLSLPEQRPMVFGTVGRLRYRYRLETFFEMSRLLTFPHQLLIVGSLDAECRHVLKMFRHDPLVGPRIIYRDYVPAHQLPDLYQAMDVLVHPVCGDVCPNVVIEALACGVPVVAPRFGGSAELVGAAGTIFECQPWVYDTGFIAALAGSVMKTLQAKDAFSLQARQQANKNFDLNVMVDRYLDALRLPHKVADSRHLARSPKGKESEIRRKIAFQGRRWHKMVAFIRQRLRHLRSRVSVIGKQTQPKIAFIQNTFNENTLKLLRSVANNLSLQCDFYFVETGNNNFKQQLEQHVRVKDPTELLAVLQKHNFQIVQVDAQRWIIDTALAAGIQHIIVVSENVQAESSISMRGVFEWLHLRDDNLPGMLEELTDLYRVLLEPQLPEV